MKQLKAVNYKLGAVKRKFGIKASDKVEPGDLINKYKEQAQKAKESAKEYTSKEKLSIMGLV